MNSRIYSGKVMHSRHVPVKQEWTYPFYFYAIDLDELELLDRTVKGFGHNHSRPAALQDKDYLRAKGNLRDQLSEFIDLDVSDKVILVTVARFVARIFNPVSFYYILRQDGTPKAQVAEVNNTFGQRHIYIMDGTESFPAECSHAKAFHVSPFNDMTGHYKFSFSAPADHLRIGIKLIRNDQTIMDAAMWGDGKELTTKNLWSTLLHHPFTASLTMPRILHQAARLYFGKKMKIFRKPVPTSTLTIKV